MASDLLRIGYAGRLRGHRPGEKAGGGLSFLKEWFWEFRNQTVDPATRSGYFLFKGLARLRKEKPELAARVRLDFWGSIDPVHLNQAKEMGVEDLLEIDGYRSREETKARLAACDVLFLPLESGRNGKKPFFIPGKLYEYLELGRPVLALTGPSDCRDILRQSGLARICDPRNEVEIADALAELVGQKERLIEEFSPDFEYIRSNFSFESLTEKLAGNFNDLLTEGKQ